jgi:preprotein translocase subunit SecE
MALNTEKQTNGKLDWLKWLIAIVLIFAGIVANYYYNSQPWPLRLIGWLVLLSIVIAVLWQTTMGKKAVEFTRESRLELRKVVWPTRQETFQTTMVIVLMVTVLALLLWGIDGFLMWVIGWLTGQRG